MNFVALFFRLHFVLSFSPFHPSPLLPFIRPLDPVAYHRTAEENYLCFHLLAVTSNYVNDCEKSFRVRTIKTKAPSLVEHRCHQNNLIARGSNKMQKLSEDRKSSLPRSRNSFFSVRDFAFVGGIRLCPSSVRGLCSSPFGFWRSRA